MMKIICNIIGWVYQAIVSWKYNICKDIKDGFKEGRKAYSSRWLRETPIRARIAWLNGDFRGYSNAMKVAGK